MPGIAGIISKKPREKNERDIGLMVDCMMHESFYSSGKYINDELGIYAGWVCHEDSFSDCMPVWNEKKNAALIFFGENFTDLELFDHLKANHHRFDRSNASYLIHLYEDKGIDFLQDLNGWFSGILIDIQKKKAVLFNDRYGMQKIFYHEGRDAFYFSSEAKSLLKICPELREIDMRGLGELLNCNCVLENRTLFNNIFLLPCAAAWTFKNDGEIKKIYYFRPDIWENQPWLEKDFFYSKLKETFRKILPKYFRSTMPIGISLTGGLDTRMIIANIDMPAGKYPCYTFGGMYRDSFDVKFARKVAKATDQAHHEVKLAESFLTDFSKYAEKTLYITDGYFDVSESPELYFNKLVREIAPIRMTGIFGGEILRTIRWPMADNLNGNHFSTDLRRSRQNIAETLAKANLNVSHPLSFNLFTETPWLETFRLVIAQSQLEVRTPFMDNDLVALMYRAPMGIRDNKEISLQLIADGNPALRKIPTDRGVGGNTKFPFSILSRLYYEFLFKAEYAYNYGMPHWLAKFDYLFMFMHFEKLFLGRHKFTHFRIWYRDELADYIRAILLDEKTLSRPYLNREVVEKMVLGHTKGYGNYTTEITQMLTVELIQRLLIEQG